MSEQNLGNSKSSKKMLEKSPLSGIAVPIAILLVGALIVFGVTKMLSTGKNHRDLVEELNSKTFGNRWVAAYELSKFLASSKIPEEDIPWVIENLSQVYRESVDARTRNFVVLALGSLKNALSLPILNAALQDQDPQVKFNAVVSLGNMPKDSEIQWGKVEELLKQEHDPGLKQVALLTMATHRHPAAQDWALNLLQSSEKTLRYSAALTLIYDKRNEAIPVLEEMMNLPYDVAAAGELNGAQVEGLKENVLDTIEKVQWRELISLVEKAQKQDPNVRVSTKAKQVLKVLKK